ncbi:MAG: hypothetical protein AB7U75_10155 [Hyphomicrobiaceae bacterium]
MAAGTIACVISVWTWLLTVPLTLNYLGTERNGMWMALAATTGTASACRFRVPMPLSAVYKGILKRASFPLLILTTAGVPLIVLGANSLVYFAGPARDLMPSLRLVSKGVIRDMGRIGGLFLVLQVAGATTYIPTM